MSGWNGVCFSRRIFSLFLVSGWNFLFFVCGIMVLSTCTRCHFVAYTSSSTTCTRWLHKLSVFPNFYTCVSKLLHVWKISKSWQIMQFSCICRFTPCNNRNCLFLGLWGIKTRMYENNFRILLFIFFKHNTISQRDRRCLSIYTKKRWNNCCRKVRYFRLYSLSLYLSGTERRYRRLFAITTSQRWHYPQTRR